MTAGFIQLDGPSEFLVGTLMMCQGTMSVTLSMTLCIVI